MYTVAYRSMAFYIGDIVGKFWGNQLPRDATHLGISPSYTYSFCGCGCVAELNTNSSELYCAQHYESFANHLERVSANDNKTYFQNNTLHYSFTSEHIPMLQAKMQGVTHTYLKSFEIIDKIVTTVPYHEVWYKYALHDNVNNVDNVNMAKVLVARLCLAKQIVYCLEKYGTCTFEVHYGFE